jgi:hypothetical protein
MTHKHFLVLVDGTTVFADRIDGFTKMKRLEGCSPPFAEFHVLLSNGETLRVHGEEKNVEKEQEHLLSILEEQQVLADEDHPQGQSG